MARLEPTDVTFFTTPEELRAWLEANHATATEKWVGSYRKAAGRPTVTWEQLVDEVLCFGWIDSVRMPYGENAGAQRITPRRDGSIWSARNVARVEALRAEGRMRPAGEAAYAKRRDDRTAIYSFEREPAFDAEAETALRADADAWAWWEAQSNSYRRAGTYWVMSAKKPETRAKRLAALADGNARLVRLVELTGKPRATKP